MKVVLEREEANLGQHCGILWYLYYKMFIKNVSVWGERIKAYKVVLNKSNQMPKALTLWFLYIYTYTHTCKLKIVI